MRIGFAAQIKWITFEEGGRKILPPRGTRYCPIIKLDCDEKEKWSIDFVCPDFKETDSIKFTFVSEAAPKERIIVGSTYELYEGDRLVASLFIDNVITSGQWE